MYNIVDNKVIKKICGMVDVESSVLTKLTIDMFCSSNCDKISSLELELVSESLSILQQLDRQRKMI